MKILVVLVVAVFTGCNANLFYADGPKSKLDQLTDALWDYVRGARQTAKDTLEKIQQTEIGQDVTAHLRNGAKIVGVYADLVWKQVPPVAKDALNEAIMISVRVEQELIRVKRKLEPLAETVAPVAERVQSRLKQGAEQVLEMASPNIEKLRENLDPMANQVQTQLTGLYDILVGSN